MANENDDELKALRMKAYYEANKERIKGRVKAYRKANKEKIKAWREDNKDKLKAYRLAYYEANKEEILSKQKTPEAREKQREVNKKHYYKYPEKAKAYYSSNKTKILERRKVYREENPERVKEIRDKYAKNNPDKVRDSKRNYAENNKVKIKIKQKKYRDEVWSGSDKQKENNRKWNAIARSTPDRRLLSSVRKRISALFNSKQNINKQTKSLELIGCDKETLFQHIEKQFVNGMNWENRSDWSVDHIIPVNFFYKLFDINDINVQKIAFHYSNLQPLFKSDNIKKSDKIYILNPLKKNLHVEVNINDPDFRLFVFLLEEQIKKKIDILKEKDLIEGVGKITDSVFNEYYKLVDEPT